MATSLSSTTPRVGEAAPDFSLDSTTGAPVRLFDHRGQRHVLLAFFPLAFTGTCTAEVCEFSSDFDRYVLIDRHGIVRWAHVEDQLGHKRETDELLSQIEALD